MAYEILGIDVTKPKNYGEFAQEYDRIRDYIEQHGSAQNRKEGFGIQNAENDLIRDLARREPQTAIALLEHCAKVPKIWVRDYAGCVALGDLAEGRQDSLLPRDRAAAIAMGVLASDACKYVRSRRAAELNRDPLDTHVLMDELMGDSRIAKLPHGGLHLVRAFTKVHFPSK